MVLIERINKIRFLFFYSSVTEFGKKMVFHYFLMTSLIYMAQE